MLFLPLVRFSFAAGEGWYNDDWLYRKSHVITYASGAGTGYQVNVTVHYGSGSDSNTDVYFEGYSRADMEDTLFTDDDGVTRLFCWREKNSTALGYAVYWLKINDDLSSVDQTIYVYFGNAAATYEEQLFDAETVYDVPMAPWIKNSAAILSARAGKFDAAGCRDLTIVRYEENSTLYRNASNYLIGFYTGLSGSTSLLGRVISSNDGSSWTREPDGAVTGGYTAASILRLSNGTFAMLAGGNPVCLYTSNDAGLTWSNVTYVLTMSQFKDENNGALSSLGVPHMIKLANGTYAAVFEGVNATSNCWDIYGAFSSNLVTWAPLNSGNPIMSQYGKAWESVGVANPKLIELDSGEFLLMYNGIWSDLNGRWRIGFAYSTDLLNWVRYDKNPVLAPTMGAGLWDSYHTECSFFVKDESASSTSYRLWFQGFATGSSDPSIGIAYCYYKYQGGQGENTFLWFDAFNQTRIDYRKWTVTSLTKFSISSDWLQCTGTTGGASSLQTTRNVTNTNSAWEMDMNVIGLGSTSLANFGVLWYPYGSSYDGEYWYAEGSNDRYIIFSGSGSFKAGTDKGMTTGLVRTNYYKVSGNLRWKTNGTRNFDENWSGTTNTPTNVSMLFFNSADNAAIQKIDFIFQRKYVSPEPSQGEWGELEIYGGAIFDVNLSSDSNFYPLQYGSHSMYITISSGEMMDLSNATLTINSEVILLWLNVSNTFSITYDPSNYAILNYGSKQDLNATCTMLEWEIAYRWNFSEGYKTGRGDAYSTLNVSSSSTSSQFFYFENDIEIHSISNNDNDGERVNPEQLITWTGQTFWESTAIDPYPDVGSDLCNVTLELDSAALNSTYISAGGTFSISYSASSSVDLYSYIIYGITPAGEVSVSNQTDQLIVDKIVVETWMADDYDVLIDTTVNFTIANFTSAYDGSAVSGLSFMINRNDTAWEPAKTGNFTDSQSNPGYYVYELSDLYNDYNLTQVNVDPGNLVVIWYSTEPGGPTSSPGFTDPGDLAEIAIVILIFGIGGLLVLIVLLRRR